jgi:hypothetical protein
MMMNVPKFLGSEAIMAAVYLINRMSSRILRLKTLCEILLGSKIFVIPPRLFGCTYFIRNHRPTMDNEQLSVSL